LDRLPIDAYVSEIVSLLERKRAIVVVADPGAGKSTRVPPGLVEAGPVLLLQPRRAAARAIAHRIATERGWTIGREVGWQIRFERRFSAETRLLVATEGILTARLQQDPLLSDFRTIVLDEFHERSLHADLGLALAKQAWRARADARLVVMSATLDAERVAAFLEDCPIVRVPGRTHPIEVAYRPAASPAEAAGDLLGESRGDVLCFLPGAFEIQKTVAELRARIASEAEILPLHGTLDASQQDRALAPARPGVRRVIVATNIAETSVTVAGVTGVVDAGLQKVARYDATRAIDSLVTERITQDAADQRAGRAGRTGPGLVRRLWDARDRLRPHREPDIHRIDLSGAVLDIVAWGGDPRAFEWFEAPRVDSIDAAMGLLERLGAIDRGSLTPVGRQMQALPLHPRLARILVAGGGSRAIAQACAVLSERLLLPPRSASTTSDLLSALDGWQSLPLHVHSVAREIERMARQAIPGEPASTSDADFRRAILAGYPDRVAARRDADSPRLKLASGTGALLAPESGVHGGEFLVAVDLQGVQGVREVRGVRGVQGVQRVREREPENRVRLASRIEREWLVPTITEVVQRLDESGEVRAFEVDRYDALVLSERPVEVDDDMAARLLAEAWLGAARSAAESRLLRRLAFAEIPFNLDSLIRDAAYGKRSLSAIRFEDALPRDVLLALDREAPERLDVPSGRSVLLDYGDAGVVSASVKLQELFGLADTPRVGRRREPVVLSLLAPNGRPVQVTRDLRSFWDRTYPEVRKELRGRYPKHPWPDDPWTAQPTARTRGRG
jgi:ATP-dependent RNA helicase HrpB